MVVDNSNSSKNVAIGNEDATTHRPNRLLEIIQNHYTIVTPIKSADQIESEKWLIRNWILFSRWFCFPAAFIIQFCCGSIYAWSVLNKPIDYLIYGDNVNVAPVTFYIAVGFYGIGAALCGPWLERVGPRRTCLTGASAFLVGNLVTSLGLHLRLIWLVFGGYGIICGAGLGMCYISPVSAIQKWFPDRRGLAAGFSTCGFGAGSVAVAKVQIPLLEAVGLPLMFVTLGFIYAFLMMSSALVLRTPPPGYTPDTLQSIPGTEMETEKAFATSREKSAEESNGIEHSTLLEALCSTQFRLMMVMCIGDIAFGLTVVSRLSNIVTDIFGQSPDLAATVVSSASGVNFIARLGFSILSDYLGRRNCFVIFLTTQAIVSGIFSTLTTSRAFIPFWIAIACSSAAYGAVFGVIPAYMTDVFGSSNIGGCHGIFIFGWSVTGVLGGLTFTLIFNSLVSHGWQPTDPAVYNVNAWWLFGLACLGWLTLFFIPSTQSDRRISKILRRFICKNSQKSFELRRNSANVNA